MQIEEQAKDIVKRVEDLGKHIGAYEQYMRSLGSSLGTTVNHYNKAYKELKKVDKDVMKTIGGSSVMDPLAIPPPELDE